MLSTKNEIEIAVRLYDNKFYGTTYGKGLYRKALYNGSIDIQEPNVKYVIDLFSFDDWRNQAKTDEQLDLLKECTQLDDALYSWIYRYDRDTKQKTLVRGCCVMDLNTNNILVLINDNYKSIDSDWKLTAKPCVQSSSGAKSPTLLATNADLSEWKRIN